MSQIKSNLERIIRQINNENITVVAISKNRSIDEITQAINSGVKFIGENRVQEAFKKYNQLNEFFKENKVKYTDINVENNQKAQKEAVEKSGQMGVPVIEIDREIVVGFEEDKLKKLLKLK